MSDSIHNRLYRLRKSLGYTQKDMAGFLGIKQNTYSSIENGKTPLTPRNKDRLIEMLRVNPLWLDGDDSVEMMSKSDAEFNQMAWPPGQQDQVDAIVGKMATPKGRPYYDIDFICGFDALFSDQPATPAYMIDYAPYNKDGVIWCNATGASMEPEINSGDVVVLQEVHDWDRYLTYGETYAIATKNDMRTIKKVRKGKDDDHFRLVPVNKEYDEQDIPKDMILKVFRVLAAMKKF